MVIGRYAQHLAWLTALSLQGCSDSTLFTFSLPHAKLPLPNAKIHYAALGQHMNKRFMTMYSAHEIVADSVSRAGSGPN